MSGTLQRGHGLEWLAARKLFPRAGPNIKLRAQGQQAAWKGVQESVKCKARLLQMYSPFHDALEYKGIPGQSADSRRRISSAWPGAPQFLVLPAPPSRYR